MGISGYFESILLAAAEVVGHFLIIGEGVGLAAGAYLGHALGTNAFPLELVIGRYPFDAELGAVTGVDFYTLVRALDFRDGGAIDVQNIAGIFCACFKARYGVFAAFTEEEEFVPGVFGTNQQGIA